MITVGMNYRVIQGKEGVFENAVAKVLHAIRKAAGHSETTLFHEVGNPSHYLIVSDWSEEQAFTDFIRSEQFAKVTNWGKEEILAGRPSHKVYRHG